MAFAGHQTAIWLDGLRHGPGTDCAPGACDTGQTSLGPQRLEAKARYREARAADASRAPGDV